MADVRDFFLVLCDTADEQLFDKIQYNKHHLLHYLITSTLGCLTVLQPPEKTA